MALNMTAFVGGAASGIIDRIDDIERKAEKKDDRAYTKSEQNRLYNRVLLSMLFHKVNTTIRIIWTQPLTID